MYSETDMPQKLQKGKTALYVYSSIRTQQHLNNNSDGYPLAIKHFFFQLHT